MSKKEKQTNKQNKQTNAQGQDYFCNWSALKPATLFYWVSVTRRVGIAAGPEVGICLSFKECFFRVRVRVRVSVNPNPNLKSAFYKKREKKKKAIDPNPAFY